MDYLDCCNVCEKQIDVGNAVIVTSDATMVAVGVQRQGVYCPDCWQELLRLEYKLWEKKGKERAKQNPDGTAPSKMASFGGQFDAKE